MAYTVTQPVHAHEPKALPVLLLLDVSGSMYGPKIDSLNEAVRTMANLLIEEERHELFSRIAVIEFADSAALRQADDPYASPKEFLAQYQDLTANGCTALGGALKEARELIEDKARTKGRWYSPAVVLVSDGAPVENDGNHWETELQRFEAGSRCRKCQRFAIAIGEDANQKILKQFIGPEGELYYAEDAGDIVKMFRRVTLSITQHFSQIHDAVKQSMSSGKPVLPMQEGKTHRPMFQVDSYTPGKSGRLHGMGTRHHGADDDQE